MKIKDLLTKVFPENIIFKLPPREHFITMRKQLGISIGIAGSESGIGWEAVVKFEKGEHILYNDARILYNYYTKKLEHDKSRLK